MIKNLTFFLFDLSNNSEAVDMKVDESFLEDISSFKILGLSFISKLDWCSHIVQAKSASKKIGTLISSMSTYSDRLHDFSVTFPGCYKDVYVNSVFHCIVGFSNSLLTECFPLMYDLTDFTSKGTSVLSLDSFEHSD